MLESTTYPGTTEEFLQPILEAGSGLRVGIDLSLAFSPERIDPGNPTFGIAQHPQGGRRARRRTARNGRVAFYAPVHRTEVVTARGTREAEMAKLLENTYRHVNIALVNEMVQFCHELDIDLWNVIELARTKPFGFQAFYPGPGVGGHCIPIDPNYLSHRVEQQLGHPFRFVELAQEINASMPAYVAAARPEPAQRQPTGDQRGRRCCCSGVTYKANIADERESPADPAGPAAAPARGRGASTTIRTSPPGACPGPGRATDLMAEVAGRRPGHPGPAATATTTWSPWRRRPACSWTPAG